MSKYMRRLGTPIALAVALTVGACSKGGDNADTSALAQDSTTSINCRISSGLAR